MGYPTRPHFRVAHILRIFFANILALLPAHISPPLPSMVFNGSRVLGFYPLHCMAKVKGPQPRRMFHTGVAAHEEPPNAASATASAASNRSVGPTSGGPLFERTQECLDATHGCLLCKARNVV
jgi:hypothetical protein